MKNDIEKLFEQAFEDQVFTREERRSIAQALGQRNLSEKELGVLQREIFRMAESESSDMETDRVIEWLRQSVKLLLKAGKPQFYQAVHFSPGADCLRAICQQIQRAQRQLDICVFTISDDRITKEIKAAHRRRVNVRVLTDNDKLYDRGSDIEEMAEAGIPVRVDHTAYHMHHKFALVDRVVLLTGSYNWTRSAAAYNEENILITEDPQLFQPYQEAFDDLWSQMKDFT